RRRLLDLGDDLDARRALQRGAEVAHRRRSGQPAFEIRFRPPLPGLRDLAALAGDDTVQDGGHVRRRGLRTWYSVPSTEYSVLKGINGGNSLPHCTIPAGG